MREETYEKYGSYTIVGALMWVAVITLYGLWLHLPVVVEVVAGTALVMAILIAWLLTSLLVGAVIVKTFVHLESRWKQW